MIFLRELIFYTQFSIFFIMIRVSKNICFKIIGSHDTLNIIVICKTYVATGPIYRIYCGVYPFSPDFKDFSVFFSLACDFLSPKSTFLCLFYTMLWLFFTEISIFFFFFFCLFYTCCGIFHLNLHFCDFFLNYAVIFCHLNLHF